MKILKIATLSLVLAASTVFPLFAGEVSDVAADHKALVASYQEKVAAQDALIQEHVQMKKDLPKRFAISPKAGPPPAFEKMVKHCDAIIDAARQEKQALLEFAKWHEMRAAELEGF